MSTIDVSVCQCPRCPAGAAHPDRVWHEQRNLLLSRLDDPQRRWSAAVEANRVGRSGARLVAQITGLDEQTIRRGQEEVAGSLADVPRQLSARHARRRATRSDARRAALPWDSSLEA